MNLKQYHEEWFQNNYPTYSLSLENRSKPFLGKFKNIPFLNYLKGILGERMKHAIKSIFSFKSLFGYPVSTFEKEVALSYVKYIFANNPEIDENIFSKESLSEIKDILSNQFHFSYGNHVPWKKLYPGSKFQELKQAQKFHKKTLRKKGEVYEYNGFKSKLANFEYGVLVNNCGIKYLPEEVRASIKNTVFVDCGAFTGDSAFVLNKLKPAEILAIEPDENNLKLLKDGIFLNRMEKITPLGCGVGEKDGSVKFVPEGICGKVSEDGQQEIKIVTIDSLGKKSSKKIGLIKMDIEGYEMKALIGAQTVIKNDKPVLIIALYHSGDDFFEIPKYVKSLNQAYQIKIVSVNPLVPLYEKYLIAY